MLVGEVMAHQGSPPENATTAHSTDESEGLAGAPSASPRDYLTRKTNSQNNNKINSKLNSKINNKIYKAKATTKTDVGVSPSSVGSGNQKRKSKTTRFANTDSDAADAAYPTDAKERERNRRNADKEAGIERTVVKRQKVVEDHHDD